MMTSTRTISPSSIELRSSVRVDEPERQTSTASTDTDNIVQASRLADGAVPDGGYGWIVVTACSLLTIDYSDLSTTGSGLLSTPL